MTKQESLNKAAQEFGYENLDDVEFSDCEPLFLRAMDIYAGEQSEYTKSLEDEIKFHCEEKDKLEKELAFEKQNATDFASKADHYRNLLSESKKNYAVAWISVEERLPEDEHNVLAVLDGKVCVMAYFSFWENGERIMVWGYSYDGVNGDAIFDDNYYPTHWQPLPTAP